ncbi:hypothetical protein L3Q82_008491, partial [Scortum barcoo]
RQEEGGPGGVAAVVMVLDSGEVFMDPVESVGSGGDLLEPEVHADPAKATAAPRPPAKHGGGVAKKGRASHNGLPVQPGSSQAAAERRASSKGVSTPRPPLRRPLSLEVTPQRLRRGSGGGQADPAAPLAKRFGRPLAAGPQPDQPASLGAGGWMRRSESTCSEKQTFFQSDYKYEPQFEYVQPEPRSVLEKYKDGSGLFLEQAVGIMECVLRKFGSYAEPHENFEEVTGGSVLPKSQVWAAVRKYLQKEGCVGEVVVRLSDELLSQAVMVVESCRPTLTINLAGARQHWLEGMLRHEIGTHYLRGVNNNLQPWATSEGRKQYGLKPANPTEEGLASLHSVLLRKQPYLWRAALLYYTVYHATSMSFSQLFSHIARFVQDPDVRWEYCLRAKRDRRTPRSPGFHYGGCFSKDQVYLDGILRILRHRRTIDFKMLTSLGKVSEKYLSPTQSLCVYIQKPAGVLRRRGAASASGGSPADQNPSLHARPGALPAAPGSHRRRQRGGRFDAGGAAALTAPSDPPTPASPEEEEEDAGTDCITWCAEYHNIQYYRCFIRAIFFVKLE